MAGKRINQIQNTSKLARLRTAITSRSKTSYNHTSVFVKRNPLKSFYIVLGLLFLVIILGHLIHQTPQVANEPPAKKSVAIYSIGESPKAAFQAKIEKSGVVKITAQVGGIVQSVNVKEGDSVSKGQTLITLANNYQGGNASAIQSQITNSQYQNVLNTYDQQKDLIQKQRDSATATADNAQQQRDITRNSNDEAKSLINATQSQLDQMNAQLQTLQQIPNPDTPQAQALSSLPGTILQTQGSLDQLRANQRNLELQSGDANPPGKLAGIQKVMAMQQLDLQQKSLDLNKEVSRLQVSLAYVAEATMYPATPFSGTVERINVHPGQNVTSGTVLATITGDSITTTAVLLVPQEVASHIGNGDPSIFTIGTKTIAVTPYHVATEATDGSLYAVFYAIPAEQEKLVNDGDYIQVQVPIGESKTTAADPLVPIDSVYISSENAQLLVVEKNKAVTRTVKLGNVYGDYVQILSGLKSGDQIITDRNVIAGDAITISSAAQ